MAIVSPGPIPPRRYPLLEDRFAPFRGDADTVVLDVEPGPVVEGTDVHRGGLATVVGDVAKQVLEELLEAARVGVDDAVSLGYQFDAGGVDARPALVPDGTQVDSVSLFDPLPVSAEVEHAFDGSLGRDVGRLVHRFEFPCGRRTVRGIGVHVQDADLVRWSSRRCSSVSNPHA